MSDVSDETRPALRVPLWLLGLLTFSGTLAMHIFVPALPLAGADLGVGTATIQLAVSLYILGLAIGQLFYGPLSDRFGRRPALMVGLVLYTAASAVAMTAQNAQVLLAARLFQALGGCAGLVLGRAIVRDLSAGSDAARRLAMMNLMVTIGPGAAPIVGGLLAQAAGWRAIFVALCLLGLANFLLTWRMLPETASRARTPGTSVIGSYGRLITSPPFLGFAIGGGCATTSMYAFIAAAPFIFTNQLHRPAAEVGPSLTVLILGVWFGSMIASRALRIFPLRRLLVVSNAASVAASLVLLAAVLTGHLTLWIAIATMFLFTLGVGVAAPVALTEAISINPRVAGSASGLYGFAQMAVGAGCTALAGIGNDPALASSLVLAISGVVAQAAFWMAFRWRRG